MNKPPQIRDDLEIPRESDLPSKVNRFNDTIVIDFLLLTVKPCEFLTCFCYLQNPLRYYSKDFGDVYIGKMGDEDDDDNINEKDNKLKVGLMTCNMGSSSAGGSAMVVKNAVTHLRPKGVFSVGFCGGMNSKKAELGDVVVSSKLISYSFVKVTQDKVEPRGTIVPLDKHLNDITRNAGHGWKAPVKDAKQAGKVVSGAMLSGPELVNDITRRNKLLKMYHDAIAIEMEGEGVYTAAHDLKVEWVVIKGISDYADGTKADTKDWQLYASLMAASVVSHMLRSSICFENWEHYGESPGGTVTVCSSGSVSSQVNKGAHAVDFQASFRNKHVAANVTLKIGDKLVTTVAVGVVSAVVTACAVTALYNSLPEEVTGAVSNAIEGLGALFGELWRGSIIVELYCDTEEDLLTFMEAFETKVVEERLQEEFEAIGFKGELEVSIINENEVFEKVEKIRYGRKHSKPSYSGTKTETFAKRGEAQSGSSKMTMSKPPQIRDDIKIPQESDLPRKIHQFSDTIVRARKMSNPPELREDVKIPKVADLSIKVKRLRGNEVIDFLLLTVKDCEFEGCLYFLKEYSKYHKTGLGFVYIGKMGDDEEEDEEKLTVGLMKCDMGSGVGGSVVAVTNAVTALKPKGVFCVGFCGGLNADKAKLGDVVVSSNLVAYAPSKVTTDGRQRRGTRVPLKKHLNDVVRLAGHGWKPPLKNSEEAGKVVNGVMLSGPELVNDEAERNALLKDYPDAVAIEMEGEGVYTAAHNLEVEWVVIKGISDYADGTKAVTKDWQPYASFMAASVVANILSSPAIFEDWPHCGGAPGETVLPLSKRLRSSSSSGSSQDNKVTSSEPSASPSKSPKLPSDPKVKAGEVSIDDREILAKKLPSHWEALGRRLKIDDSVLTGIQRDGLNYPVYTDKARAMLIKWQERDGEEATYQVLYDALCHELVERRDLAEKICWK